MSNTKRQPVLEELRSNIISCVIDKDAVEVSTTSVDGGTVLTICTDTFSPRFLEADLIPSGSSSHRTEGCSSESLHGPQNAGGHSLTLAWNTEEQWGFYADTRWPANLSQEDFVTAEVAVIAGTPEAVAAWADTHLKTIASRATSQAIAEFEDVPAEHLLSALNLLAKRAEELGCTDPNAAFVRRVAELSIWDFDRSGGTPYAECEEPSEGYGDSHNCLMNLIEDARSI